VNEVARSYTHNLLVIFLVMLTFILDLVLVGFLEVSYYIPTKTCNVVEAYEGDHLSNTMVYKFFHTTNTGGMYMIKNSFSQLGWFHGSKVE